jgi:hypothetical protein
MKPLSLIFWRFDIANYDSTWYVPQHLHGGGEAGSCWNSDAEARYIAD